jgi:GNAT superfamily N-acetyltransferase
LPALPSLEVRRTTDLGLLAVLQNRPVAELQQRFVDGHRAYVAWEDGVAAAFGWVATRAAVIGELGATLQIPNGHRYLWNFVTLASHRGRGIYPRLLDAIVRAESDAEVFWIAYAPENHASGVGIERAGFTRVAALSFDATGSPAIRAFSERPSIDASRMLRLPVASAELSPCWKCVRAGRGAMSCPAGACQCDYQRPQVACAG